MVEQSSWDGSYSSLPNPGDACVWGRSPKEKAPRFPAGLVESFADASLVLGNQRLRSFWSPEPEAKAGEHVHRAYAFSEVLRGDRIRHPDLQIDRAEIVADQTTDGGCTKPVADAKRGRDTNSRAARIRGCLNFEGAHRSD